MADPTVTMRAESAPPAQPKKVQALPRGWFELTATRTDDNGTEFPMKLVVSDDLTPEEEMDMAVFIPVEKLVNPVWMQWARLAATVRRIDGDPCPLPQTEAQVRATMKRVGRDGMRMVERMWSLKYAAAIAEVKKRAKKS